jgi:hypothetical protein
MVAQRCAAGRQGGAAATVNWAGAAKRDIGSIIYIMRIAPFAAEELIDLRIRIWAARTMPRATNSVLAFAWIAF